MDDRSIRILKSLNAALTVTIDKVDHENQDWVKPAALPENQIDAVVKAIGVLETAVQSFFISQQKDYLKIIRQLPKLLKKKAIKKEDSVSDDTINQISDVIGQFVFSQEEYQIDKLAEIYEAFAAPFISSMAQVVAKTVEGSKAEPKYSQSDIATKWLDMHKIQFATEVQQTTHDTVIQCLKDGLAGKNGVNITSNDLVAALPQYFKQGRIKSLAGKLKGTSDVDIYNELYQQIDDLKCFQFYRARRIAQHETMTALNAATLEGYRQSKVVEKKEWMCACDERSREAHKKADGQIVAIDEPFIVGGEELMHPGDSSMGASAKNVIGCRCTMLAVIDTDEE
jgi:uncharacterized protein with gpF-like domain